MMKIFTFLILSAVFLSLFVISFPFTVYAQTPSLVDLKLTQSFLEIDNFETYHFVGSSSTFAVTVTNIASTPANNVNVEILIPSSSYFDFDASSIDFLPLTSNDAKQYCSELNNVITCEIPSLENTLRFEIELLNSNFPVSELFRTTVTHDNDANTQNNILPSSRVVREIPDIDLAIGTYDTFVRKLDHNTRQIPVNFSIFNLGSSYEKIPFRSSVFLEPDSPSLIVKTIPSLTHLPDACSLDTSHSINCVFHSNTDLIDYPRPDVPLTGTVTYQIQGYETTTVNIVSEITLIPGLEDVDNPDNNKRISPVILDFSLPTLEIDQSDHGPWDSISILLTKPEANQHPQHIETYYVDATTDGIKCHRLLIITDSDGPVECIGPMSYLGAYGILDFPLVETSANSGVFRGDLQLELGNMPRDPAPIGYGGPYSVYAHGDKLTTTYDSRLNVKFYDQDHGKWIRDITDIGLFEGRIEILGIDVPDPSFVTIRVIDPDRNSNPVIRDELFVDVWLSSDSSNIQTLNLVETSHRSGIFEGVVLASSIDESSAVVLRLLEGDSISVRYIDEYYPGNVVYYLQETTEFTPEEIIHSKQSYLPPPFLIVENLRVTDPFGNPESSVSVGNQVQITADIINEQRRSQNFSYLLQIQDVDGVTSSLAWINGSLSIGQSFSPSLPWIPSEPGTYTVTVFVWESIDNPLALSPPLFTTINVS